jgi:iron complex outermembrane receptor protein
VSKNKRSPVVFAKKSSIAATEVALALMAAQFAYAQQPTQTAERVERVEITGTRLPALNVEGPSPVTVMDAQEIRMDGLSKAEDVLLTLPQVYSAQGSASSNGATGTAQVNLRNMGPTRNLVLINGRRLPPGSPQNGQYSYAADLNQIPVPLIQRVELLTGGASAVYGSDAMTGVVNFIMNDKFEGLQLDLNYSGYNHQQHNDRVSSIVSGRAATNPAQFKVPGDVDFDGRVKGFSLLMGGNFADNRGNATVFLDYKKENPVLQANRDFSACSLNAGSSFTCGGSSTSFPGRFTLADGTSRTVADSAGNTRAFSSATDQFNFGPYNYYRRPAEQLGFNAFAHLDVNPQVRAYTELGFHDNHTDAQIAPSGVFFGNTQNIDFINPLLSADWKTRMAAANAAAGAGPFAAPGNTSAVIIGRRNVEGGGRDDDIRHSSYRGVAGIKGELVKNWNYDLFAQYGKVLYQDIYRHDFSNVRIGRAIDVIPNGATINGVTLTSGRVPVGTPVCRSEADGSDANCRPYNIWALGGVTSDAINYLEAPGLQSGSTQQTVLGATLSAGDLSSYGLKMPTAKNGLGVVFGVEQRKERLKLDTDTEFSTFDLAGQGGPIIGVQGVLNADEYFTEARLPLIEGLPMMHELTVSGSYRHSDYSTHKTTNTYGLGAEWAPVRNYRLRGSYQRAVRHANIVELFQAQGANLFGMTGGDPCGASMSATAAQCARSGVTPAQYGSAFLDSPAGQFNFLQGGNTDLKPETANTYTLGLVLNPVRNLTATVDWWSIKITDAIGNAPPETLLNACLKTGAFCNLIQRDANGTLWLQGGGKIVALNQNLGGYNATGLDLALNYTQSMGAWGGLGVHFLGSYVDKWEFEPIKGAGSFDCAGLFGGQCSSAGGPNPKWRHKLRGTWSTPWNTDLALTWRHIDKVNHEKTSSNPLLFDSTLPATERTMGTRDYFDIAGAWTINKTLTLRAGINNIFDRDPPIVSTGTADPSIFGNGNTFPQTYDALGRLIFLNLVVKL